MSMPPIGKVTLRHGQRVSVRLELVEPAERSHILRRYPEVAPGARPHIPVDPHPPIEDFERIPTPYPVFRICAYSDQ